MDITYSAILLALFAIQLASSGEYCSQRYRHRHDAQKYCTYGCCSDDSSRDPCCSHTYTPVYRTRYFVGSMISGCILLTAVCVVVLLWCLRQRRLQRLPQRVIYANNGNPQYPAANVAHNPYANPAMNSHMPNNPGNYPMPNHPGNYPMANNPGNYPMATSNIQSPNAQEQPPALFVMEPPPYDETLPSYGEATGHKS